MSRALGHLFQTSGLGPVVSKILHGVTPLVAGSFVRQQGQTQGLNLTAMLDGGIRFIDFRIMYTDAPGKSGDRDWYCLHGCQTTHTAAIYLGQLKAWLAAHPTEVVVLWSSRHGDNGINGAAQYPDTTPAVRQAFWHEVVAIFGEMLFDSSNATLAETPVATMLKKRQQLVWYAADWAEFTGSSARAIDNAQIDNQLPGASWSPGGQADLARTFASATATRAADKAANRFFLVSLADSPPGSVVEEAAELRFLPFFDPKGHTETCAKQFPSLNMSGWCPVTLMDCSLLAAYYNQVALDAAYNRPDSDFPTAIYLDAVDIGGTIRTGTELINPLQDRGGALTAHNTTRYAYVATLIGATVKRLCKATSGSADCAALLATVEAERAKHPLTLWEDAEHGRSAKPLARASIVGGGADRSGVRASPGTIIYVSPDGRDSNPGSLPTRAVRTIRRAQVLLRARRSTSAEVRVAPGSYPQNETLVFDNELDGNVVWKAGWTSGGDGHEKPGRRGNASVVSFGISLANGGWHKGAGKNLWHRTVSEVAAVGVASPRQMWDANTGDRMPRARSPNPGEYFTIAIDGALPDTANKGFFFPKGSLDASNWSDVSEMELVIFASWTSSRHFVASLTPANRSVRLTSPCGFAITGMWPNSGNRFYAENAIEMVDSEGEWHLAKATGVLTLYSATDPNSRSFVLDRGADVKEAISVAGVRPAERWLVPASKRASGANAVRLPPATIPWGNSSFVLSLQMLAQPYEHGNLFFKGPTSLAHVPGDRKLYVDGGNIALDMGWVGHLEKGAPGTDVLHTQRMVGSIKVDDGKPHNVELKFDAADGAYTLLVDGAVDATGTFGAGPDSDAADWMVVVGNMTGGWASNVKYSYVESVAIESLTFEGPLSIEHVVGSTLA